MRLNPLSFALGNLFGAVVVGLTIVACGGGSSSVETAGPGSIRAANVILEGAAAAGGGLVRVQAADLPANVRVLASQVTLETAKNRLRTTDLQSALDDEIALDNARALVGTWDVENTADDDIYRGAGASGRVRFLDDGRYELLSGAFAAAGKVAPGTNTICLQATALGYGFVGNGAIRFQADRGGDAFGFVVESRADRMTIVGQGGCGNVGAMRISRLVRVAVPTAGASLGASLKPPREPA